MNLLAIESVWGNCFVSRAQRRGGLLSLRQAFALPAVAAGDDPELVEPALERAVPERRAARGL